MTNYSYTIALLKAAKLHKIPNTKGYVTNAQIAEHVKMSPKTKRADLIQALIDMEASERQGEIIDIAKESSPVMTNFFDELCMEISSNPEIGYWSSYHLWWYSNMLGRYVVKFYKLRDYVKKWFKNNNVP